MRFKGVRTDGVDCPVVVAMNNLEYTTANTVHAKKIVLNLLHLVRVELSNDVRSSAYFDVSSVSVTIREDSIGCANDEIADKERVGRDGCIVRIIALDWSKIRYNRVYNFETFSRCSITQTPNIHSFS